MDAQPKKDDDMTKDILTEFIEVLVHQVLHLRDLYPASIFKKHRKFNMPVQMSVQPWVNEYIEKNSKFWDQRKKKKRQRKTK